MSRYSITSRPLVDSGPFGTYAEQLARAGYECVPITLLRDGDKSAGKRPAISAWQNGCPEDQRHHYAHCGLGILCRTTPALDLGRAAEQVTSGL